VLAIQTGTITNCGLQFTSAANTGLVYVAPNKFNAVANGTSVCTFSNTNTIFYGQIFGSNGSAAAPAIGNSTATTTGLFWDTVAPSINTTVNGVQKMNVSATSVQLNGVPLDANGNNVQNAPQVGNAAGNLELKLNSTGAGGTLTITGGTGIIAATAGGASGQHLVLTINGVNYKIALLNP
jgi:hypothetical protein